MEHQQYKTIKSYWTLLPIVLFLCSGCLLIYFGVTRYPEWFLNILLDGLLAASIVLDYVKCRCPYCHSIKVAGRYHPKGSMEHCPKCKHLIYYD